MNPAVGWLSALTLAFLASSSHSLFWLTVFCLLPLTAITIHVKRTAAKFPKIFLIMAIFVIAVRLGFRILFGQSDPNGFGWLLPKISLNFGWLGELHLLGFVSTSSLYAGLSDGLRLAAIILAIAMASTLISARALLRHTPAALYELSTAVSIAVNLAPQLINSLARVQRARALRGRSKKISLLSSIVIPVLEDTIDQSMALAASMDARGFGYLKLNSRTKLRTLLAIALVLIAIGVYLLLTGVNAVAYGCILLALLATALVVRAASKSSVRNNSKPLVWSWLDIAALFFAVSVVAARISGWWLP